MGLIASINKFIGLIVAVLKQFGRGYIWLILLAYFSINWLVLYAHFDFTTPIFAPIISAWAGFIGGERTVPFFHYPTHLLFLPFFFGWAKFIVGLVFEGLFLGAVAKLFANSFDRLNGSDKLPILSSPKLWLNLVLGWIVLNGLFLLLNSQIPSLLESVVKGSPRRELALELVLMPSLYVCVLAPLYALIPTIAVTGESVFKSMRRSFYIFQHNPIATILLSCSLLVVPILFSVASGRPDTIISKFRPELVYWVLAGGLVFDILINFFWIGTAVKLLLEED